MYAFLTYNTIKQIKNTKAMKRFSAFLKDFLSFGRIIAYSLLKHKFFLKTA